MNLALYNIFERIMFFGAGLGIPGAPAGTQGGGAAEGVDLSATAPAPPPEAGGFGWMTWVVIYGALFLGMYFVFIRPNRKREKQRREMVAAIKTGDNIVTTGGLFGKIAEVGEDCFMVEFGTNRGLRIPVLKGDVVGVRDPKMTPPPKEM